MKKIDTQNWGEFKIGDFFNAERGSVKKMQTLTEGDVPVIAAARKNQGVAGYYQVDAAYENRITVSCNGVGCGSTFYHDYPFNINGDAIVLIEKQEISAYAKRFVCCMLDGILTRKYSYAEKCSPEKALGEIIRLPVDELGIPDWSYMEQYMHSIQDSVKQTINAYNVLLVGGGKKLNISKFMPFNLYDNNLFLIDSGTKLDRVRMTNNCPQINFVGRANANNGVTDFIDEIEGVKPYKAGNLTLSLGGEYLGSCFVQEKDFYTSQNVVVLIPRQPMSDYSKRFIATMIFKEGRLHYKAFIDELNRHIKTDFTILLPTTESGTPDWDYMDQYMRQMEKKAKQLLEKAA